MNKTEVSKSWLHKLARGSYDAQEGWQYSEAADEPGDSFTLFHEMVENLTEAVDSYNILAPKDRQMRLLPVASDSHAQKNFLISLSTAQLAIQMESHSVSLKLFQVQGYQRMLSESTTYHITLDSLGRPWWRESSKKRSMRLLSSDHMIQDWLEMLCRLYWVSA